MEKGQLILLVEDDESIIWALNEILRGEGFEVYELKGEAEAARYLDEGHMPD